MSRKIYTVAVEEIELEEIESYVRKRITEMITKEITAHSKYLAEHIINGKPLKKQRWYHAINQTKEK